MTQLCLRLFACLMLLALPAARAGEKVVLKAARLIDGRGGAPLAPAMVLVDGERITAVGAQLAVPAGARVIDLGGATLLPGLIDLHTHLTIRYGENWEEQLVKYTPAHAALWGAANARTTLLAGFTTCRDMGTSWPYVDVDLREAIAAGAVPGPRLYVAGSYVSTTGGAGDAKQFSDYVQVPLVDNLADSPAEVTKQVRKNFKHGADFIKLLATGAVLSLGITPGAQQFSDEEIAAAVTEANRWGRPVAVHAHGAQGIKAVIRAGVRTVDHGSFLDDEAIALLKAARGKTYYVPTLYTMTALERDGRKNGVPESELQRARMVAPQMRLGFQRALAAGLPIGYGTDSGVIPHGENAEELIVRVGLGEPPMAALVAATGLNAEILGWSDRVGTVEPGKYADLIALAANPLDDITAVRNVGFVMKGGAVCKDELPRR
jgi:imidazolonepropionase-like amidohydrolase